MTTPILTQSEYRINTDCVNEFISFIVPVFNEEEVLPQFFDEFTQFLCQNKFNNYEIVFVDDGSSDRSLKYMRSLVQTNSRVKVVCLSRNFGKEIALAAGLDHASGDAVIPIDADLQHPFPVILEFVEHWRDGFDVVYAVQTERRQSWARRQLSKVFHYVFSKLGNNGNAQQNAGDFRLLSRRAVNSLNAMREKHRVMKGLYSYIGLPQKPVYFSANERRAGTSKWGFFKLFLLSIESITCVTTAPLRLATIFGLASACLAITYAFFVVVKTLIYGNPVDGYPTLVTIILLLGGIQLLSLGVIGEYLGRVFNETKNRPLYFVEEVFESKSAAQKKKAA